MADSTKITTKTVKEIHKRVANGEHYRSIAKNMGVSVSTISRHITAEAKLAKKRRRLHETQETREKRLLIWKHNSYIGRAWQAKAMAENVMLLTTASQEAKRLAEVIANAAYKLEHELRNNRIGP